MPDPSRPATEDDRTDSREPLDPTAPRADADPSGTAPEPHFAPPEYRGEVGTFGRYRVLKKLGQGGMGAVYLGYDGALERKIALKVMLPQYASNRAARDRFLREARSAAKVKSDYVVTIFDVGEAGGVPFIAMEYLLGFPLDQYLRTKGELPLDQVLRIGREAALGLAAAHELGMIHRDVKPGNIWLEAPNGRVKLLDFGLARPADDDAHLTNSGAVVGTPAYMSPEQGRGLKLDHRSDLFSLGVMLYRLATGKMPFSGATTMAVLTSLAVDTPAPVRERNPHVPEALEAVINRLLAKNPAERFQSAPEVAEALRAIETGPLPVVVALPVQPFAVGAQTQNVWDGIDASESAPVPLATGAETEPTPVPAPKPRTTSARRPSKVPLLLAGAGLLVACAVFAAVILQPWKTKPDAVQTDGGEKPGPTPVVKPPPVPLGPDPDRAAAEFVLSIGSPVKVNGGTHEIGDVSALPKTRFSLTAVLLRNNKKVTDDELAVFKECPGLTYLDLNNTKTSNAGLAHVKDCRNLTFLRLRQTLITDTGLALLNGHKNLTTLDVRLTAITVAALEAFSKALPNCRIEHTGGIIEPTAVADADRKAAEYAISLGGRVRVNGEKKEILTAVDLPKGRFDLAEVVIEYKGNVTEADLANFKGCKGLTRLHLRGALAANAVAGLASFKDCTSLTTLHLGDTPVDDAGLAHFKDCTNLTTLILGGTQVTDAGLAHFKDCKNLTELNLNNTPVGDAGLANFKGCKSLTKLLVRKTKVTAKGADELAKVLPQCRIEHDGGIIEPTKK